MITRQLGESRAEVVAIEGSLNRAKCIALRCSDLPNVKIYCSDFQAVKFEKEFDLVTLIGVLEYAPVYFKKDNPLLACLRVAKETLKPNGKLIIAIENRLGLKYFMGFSEDHYGKPYIGLQDLYPPKNAATLGRYELKEILLQSGFKSVEFQYPFPDYKIPNVMLTQKAFETEGFSPGEIIAQSKSRDHLKDFSPPFLENLVWYNIASNHLVPDLSNSFLVIAKLEENKIEEENPLLAVSYSLDRKREYKTETRFILKSNSQIEVVKKQLFPPKASHSKVIRIRTKKCKYIKGTSLNLEMIKSYLKGDIDKFFYCCDKWVDYIKQFGFKKSCKKSIKSQIKPEFIDCIPINLMIKENKLEFFDREWIYEKPYTAEMLIIRGLYQFQTMNSLEEFLLGDKSEFSKIIRQWLNKQRIDLTNSLIDKFIKAENYICDEVYGENVWQPVRALQKSNISNIKYLFGSLSRKIKSFTHVPAPT